MSVLENINLDLNSSIFVLTGAGISAESGIQTFRASTGLWNQHKIEDVASPEGFYRSPSLVYKFYNQRRKELLSGIKPNKGHLSLVDLEKYFKIYIITQNIDNLHERAGSTSVTHMHGELLQVRCIKNEEHIFNWHNDLDEKNKCEICNSSMRPNITWFGEIPMHMDKIYKLAEEADLFISIGTSGSVYPAAGFVSLFNEMGKPTIELNLEPSANIHQFTYSIHNKPATIAVEELKNILIKNNT